MPIEIRKGNKQDLENFIVLLQQVRQGMEHKEWFYLDPPETFRSMMEKGILQLWVAMDGDRTAAAFDILIPGFEEFNYGYDLGFTKEELLQVINMDSVAVDPDYRGLGLQQKLMEAAEESVTGAGKRILLCTIHPDNRYSLNNALQQGFTIQKKLEKYGSIRYILRKNIF